MFLFRADGNASIGAGHVMRCLSIADAARNAGIKCVFVTSGCEFSDIIKRRGHRIEVLGTDYRIMDSELAEMKRVVETEYPTVIFVDSYYVTKRYLEELRNVATYSGLTGANYPSDGLTMTLNNSTIDLKSKLVYIDDVLSFAYPCDILINYNIYADEADYRKLYTGFDVPKLLLGTSFAPLRGEFRLMMKECVHDCSYHGGNYSDKTASPTGTGNMSVFISTGGADFEHLMIELVKAVKSLPNTKGYVFHFVLGAANEDKNIILPEASGVDRICLHDNVMDMAKLMRSCDVAISAAGSTLYELCAAQVPTITYILADNQVPGACGFERRGIMKCAGDIRDIGAKEMAARLIELALELCKDQAERRIMADRQSSVVDGKGAERIVRAIGMGGIVEQTNN